VSSGQVGETTKQSSISGSVAPRVKVSFAVKLGYVPVCELVGIPPSSTGRYSAVQRETSVPSIVGSPVRLKYLALVSQMNPHKERDKLTSGWSNSL
jgi:hypothetical protein